MKQLLLAFLFLPAFASAGGDSTTIRIMSPRGVPMDIPYAANTFPSSGFAGAGTASPDMQLTINAPAFDFISSLYNTKLVVQSGADHSVEFLSFETGNVVGKFMKAGPGQYVDFGINRVIANNKGIFFASNDTSMYNNYGINYLSQASSARSIVGAITDDGTTKFQTLSLGTFSLKWYGTTSNGYVLTSDGSGNFTPQPNTNGTGGSYTPTFTGVINTGTLSGAQGLYTISGGVYTLSVSGAMASVPTANTVVKIKVSLPATSTTRSYDGQGTWFLSSTTIPYTTGVVQITTGDPGNAYLYFIPSSTTGGQFNFTIQYK